MFRSPFTNAFGLDIADSSMKLVQLRNNSFIHQKPKYDVVAARSIDLPKGLIVNGIIEEPEPVRKYIQHLLQGNKKKDLITSPWVVASVPEKQSFLKMITIEKEPEDILEPDVLSAAKQHIPFEADQYYLDWQLIPSNTPGTSSVLIAVTQKSIADMYTYLLESVGLGVVALEIESLAIGRAMITATKLYEGEARAVLDISATQSIFFIYDNESIQFSTVLPYCGNQVTEGLIKDMGLSHAEAIQVKHKVGLQHDKKNEKAWKSMMSSTDELAMHIQKTIDFYYSHFPQANKVTQVTISGGGALLQQLPEVLQEKISLPIIQGLVWKNLSSSKKHSISRRDGLRYSTAVGLALRAADNPFFSHDNV